MGSIPSYLLKSFLIYHSGVKIFLKSHLFLQTNFFQQDMLLIKSFSPLWVCFLSSFTFFKRCLLTLIRLCSDTFAQTILDNFPFLFYSLHCKLEYLTWQFQFWGFLPTYELISKKKTDQGKPRNILNISINIKIKPWMRHVFEQMLKCVHYKRSVWQVYSAANFVILFRLTGPEMYYKI